MTQVILIDSRNAVFRHNSVNLHLTKEDGFPTGAVYGCLNSMLTLHKHLPDAAIVWVWDGRGETWRHKFMNEHPKIELPKDEEPEEDLDNSLAALSREYNASLQSAWGLSLIERKARKPKKYGYKANRARPENEKKTGKQPKYPEDPRERALLQIPVLKSVLDTCGIRNYEVEGLECDDLIAMLAKKIKRLDHDAEIYIHSGDKDYFQLLPWKNIKIITNVKDGKLNKIKSENVLEEYGVEAKDWAKYEAFTGGHNNVGKIKGIGPVAAKNMLEDGIDPSQAKPPVIGEQYKRYFPLGIEKMWSSVHNNYKLCRLVYEPDDELLSTEVREKLAPMFSHLDSTKRFYRSSKGTTAEAYRRVTFLLQRYEMASIIARRDQLWDIP